MCSSQTSESGLRTPRLPIELVITVIQHLSKLDNSLSSLRSCSLVSRDWFTITVPILYARPFLFDGKSDEDSDAQFKTFKLARLKYLVRTMLSSLTFKERTALWGAGGADATLFAPTRAKESAFPVSRSTNRRLAKEAAGAYEEAMRKLTGPSQQEEESKSSLKPVSLDYLTFLVSFDFAKFFYGLHLLNLLPKSHQTLTTLFTFVFVHAKRLDTLTFSRAPGSRPGFSRNSIPQQSPYYSHAQLDPPTPIPTNLSDLAKARGRNIRRIQLTHAGAAETLRKLTPYCSRLKAIVIDIHDVQSRFARDETDRDTMELDNALSQLIQVQESAINQTPIRNSVNENMGNRVPMYDVQAMQVSNGNRHPIDVPKLEMLVVSNGALLWDHVDFLFSLVKTGLALTLLDLRLYSLQLSVSTIFLLSRCISLRRLHLEGKMRWPGSTDEVAFGVAPHEQSAWLNEQILTLLHLDDASSSALSRPAVFLPAMDTFFAAMSNTLTHFSVESCPEFILNQMADHWHNLHTLCLRRGSYSLRTWQILTNGCPQIRDLELINCHGLDEHALRCLTGTSRDGTSENVSSPEPYLPLESLSLQLLGLPNPVISVIPFFKNLRTLTLSGIHSMTDYGFKHGLVTGIALECKRFEALLLKDIWASGLAEDGGGGIGTEYAGTGGPTFGGSTERGRNGTETGWITDGQIEWARAAGVNAMRIAATRRHG